MSRVNPVLKTVVSLVLLVLGIVFAVLVVPQIQLWLKSSQLTPGTPSASGSSPLTSRICRYAAFPEDYCLLPSLQKGGTDCACLRNGQQVKGLISVFPEDLPSPAGVPLPLQNRR